jgi:hypothetical protein
VRLVKQILRRSQGLEDNIFRIREPAARGIGFRKVDDLGIGRAKFIERLRQRVLTEFPVDPVGKRIIHNIYPAPQTPCP